MADSTESFIDRHYFILRRLHSLSGIFPIGVFLIEHLVTNSAIVWGTVLGHGEHGHAGVEAFQHDVNFIYNLPALPLIEWGVLFIPILFHAVLGVFFARSGRVNVRAYGYQDNWRYAWQRISGYVGIVFIFMHITSLRFGWNYGGLMPSFDRFHAASTTANHFQNGTVGILLSLFYLVCVLLLVFHFANGLWTAAITWGLTISVQAQKRWGYVCAALGLALSGAAVAAILGFTFVDIDEARQVETRMLQGHGPAESGETAPGDGSTYGPIGNSDETEPDH